MVISPAGSSVWQTAAGLSAPGALGFLPPLLSGTMLVAAFGWVLVAFGYRVLRLVRFPLSAFNVWERGVVSLTIGTGLAQYVPYSLGMSGHLESRSVLVGLSLLAVAAAYDLVRVARAFVRASTALWLKKPALSTIVWVNVFALFAGALLLGAVVPGPFDDGDGYHLSAPRRWLAAGALSYLPTLTNTNASMGFEMFYVDGLATGNPFCLKVFHYGAGLMMLLALALSAQRLAGTNAALSVVSGLLIANPIFNVPILFSLAYVDFGACWMAAVTILLFLAWRERRDPRILACMALTAGFAGSFKTTALVVAFAWAPIIAWEMRRQGAPWLRIARDGVGLGLIAIAPVVPWLVRTWRVTGNPIYPMLPNVIPTRDWNPEIARVFGRYMRYYSWAIASGSRLDEAHRKAFVLIAAVVIFGAGALLFRLLRDHALRSLVVFATLFLLLTVGTTGLYFRYWLPGVIGMGLALASAWGQRSARVPGGAWVPVVLLTCALAVQVKGGFPTLSSVPVMTRLRVATGNEPLDAAFSPDPFWKMWHYINENTPADAGILAASFYSTFGASTFGGFWIQRPVFATDSHLQAAIRLDEWGAFLESLRKLGVTYVLISEQQYSPGRQGFAFPAAKNEYPFCRRLADEYGEEVAHISSLQLYRVDTLRPPRLDARTMNPETAPSPSL